MLEFSQWMYPHPEYAAILARNRGRVKQKVHERKELSLEKESTMPPFDPAKSESQVYNRLVLRALESSDMFVLHEVRKMFSIDNRQAIALALRWLYAGWHDETMRSMIRELATQVLSTDLEIRSPVRYKTLKEIEEG